MNKKVVVFITLILVMPAFSIAGEKEDELIAKVVLAYGGDALINLSNYKVDEKYLSLTVGQGHSPALMEVGRSNQVLHHDIINNKVAYDSWNEGRGGGNQGATIVNGETAYAVNFAAGTYGDANSADPYAIAGGTMRTSDTILVRELHKAKDNASLLADEKYMNRLHHILEVPFPLSPDLKLYIDAETFKVSRMLRVNPQLGNLDYVFSDYKTHNDISYASSTVFSIAGQPNLISLSRELSFNIEMPENLFNLPEGMKEEAERIDTSEMLATKISDGVFHVGQNGGFSLFIDTSVGTIGVGGYPGLPDRLERYRKESDRFQPLSYQVVTHHHADHLGAVAEAASLGARLVTVSENVQTIMDSNNGALEDRDFLSISGRATFGLGKSRVEVYEVSTSHSASFLVTYVPAAKTVFIADHFGSPFASGTPMAGQGTVDMLAALEALDVDVRKIATAHNARIFSLEDMKKSVAAFKPNTCDGGRPACL